MEDALVILVICAVFFVWLASAAMRWLARNLAARHRLRTSGLILLGVLSSVPLCWMMIVVPLGGLAGPFPAWLLMYGMLGEFFKSPGSIGLAADKDLQYLAAFSLVTIVVPVIVFVREARKSYNQRAPQPQQPAASTFNP